MHHFATTTSGSTVLNFNDSASPALRKHRIANAATSALLSAAGACLLMSGAAHAQQADGAGDTIVVTAHRNAQRSFDAPAAIQAVDAQAIREAGPGVNASEVLTRIPGVSVLNRQNYAQDLQISIRGFGARSTFGVRGVRLIVDGIPATMPDGQGQAATIPLGSAQRIEVLRGPSALLYGNAAGGVVQSFTEDGPAAPTAELRYAVGSYDTTRLGLKLGGSTGPLNYVLDWTRFDTDGYRVNSATRREQLNAKVRYDISSATRVTLLANSFDQPLGQDPLGLTRAQLEADPRQAGTNALTQRTRKTIRQQQLGLVGEHALNNDNRLTARIYGGTREVTQWQSIPVASQTGATHPGGVIDLDRSYQGASLAWNHKGFISGMRLQTTVGVDYDTMKERRRGFLNTGGITGALRRDEDNTVANTDVFAIGQLSVTDTLSVQAGVRSSRVNFKTEDYYIVTGNPNDSGSQSYSATNPVLGLTWHATPDLNVYANLGRGFETPTFAELAYRPGGATGLNYALNASKSRHLELGMKARLGPNHRVDAALFSIRTQDELVTDTSSGGRTTFKNGGRTLREGLELAWSGRLMPEVTAMVSATLLRANFRDAMTSGTTPIAAGNTIPGTTSRTVFGELAWRPQGNGLFGKGFHTALEVLHVGRIYANDANTQFAQARTTTHWRAGFEQRTGSWKFNQFARVDNLGDKKYIGSVIVNEANGRFFESAPGRSWLIGASVSKAF